MMHRVNRTRKGRICNEICDAIQESEHLRHFPGVFYGKKVADIIELRSSLRCISRPHTRQAKPAPHLRLRGVARGKVPAFFDTYSSAISDRGVSNIYNQKCDEISRRTTLALLPLRSLRWGRSTCLGGGA